MAFDIALNRKDHDIQFKEMRPGVYGLFLVEGQDLIAQKIKVALKTFLGEWFLNKNYGVPYFEEILKANPKASAIEAIFRSTITGVEGVSRVSSLRLEFVREQRLLNVSFEVHTDYGPISESYLLNILRL